MMLALWLSELILIYSEFLTLHLENILPTTQFKKQRMSDDPLHQVDNNSDLDNFAQNIFVI